jgi:hypothetical protein
MRMRHYRAIVPWCSREARAVTEETGRPLARAGHRFALRALGRAACVRLARGRRPGRAAARRPLVLRAPATRVLRVCGQRPERGGEHPCSFHRLIPRAVDNPTAEPDTHAGLIRDPAGLPTIKNLVVAAPSHALSLARPSNAASTAAPGRRLAARPIIGRSARAGDAASRPPCARRPARPPAVVVVPSRRKGLFPTRPSSLRLPGASCAGHVPSRQVAPGPGARPAPPALGHARAATGR